jgi:hypothetical protein
MRTWLGAAIVGLLFTFIACVGTGASVITPQSWWEFALAWGFITGLAYMLGEHKR